MTQETAKTLLRARIGRVLFEEPGHDRAWGSLSDEKRAPWLADADRVIAETKISDALDALSELCEIVQGVIDSRSAEGLVDSFTLQPARTALAQFVSQ